MLETEATNSFLTSNLAQVFFFLYQAPVSCRKLQENLDFTEEVLGKETENGKCYPWQSIYKCPKTQLNTYNLSEDLPM